MPSVCHWVVKVLPMCVHICSLVPRMTHRRRLPYLHFWELHLFRQTFYFDSICGDCKLKLWKIKPFPHQAPSSELKQTPALYNSLQKLLIANFGLSQPSPAEPPPAPFQLVIPTNQVMPHTSTIRGPNRPICDLPSCHSSANLRHLPI